MERAFKKVLARSGFNHVSYDIKYNVMIGMAILLQFFHFRLQLRDSFVDGIKVILDRGHVLGKVFFNLLKGE